MGYELARFIDQIHEEYLCSICSLVVQDPVESSNCGHIYCNVCMKGWLALDRSCPEDRSSLKPEELKSPSRLIQSLLNKLRMQCDYYSNGCQAIVSLNDLKGHVTTCSFQKNGDYQYTMSPEEEDNLNLIDELILHQELELTASPWQVCHNVKTADNQILECDGRSALGITQSSAPLGEKNSFRVQILNLDSAKYLAIGLTGKGHPMDKIPGLHMRSIGFDSGGDNIIDNKSKKVGLEWKVGDIIECGIKSSDTTNGALVYFKRNHQVVAENRVPSDVYFPTIYMYEGVVGSMWGSANNWQSSNTRTKVKYFGIEAQLDEICDFLVPSDDEDFLGFESD